MNTIHHKQQQNRIVFLVYIVDVILVVLMFLFALLFLCSYNLIEQRKRDASAQNSASANNKYYFSEKCSFLFGECICWQYGRFGVG